MSDDVLAEASQEITKGWRAGMQVAEFLARRRQRDLTRAERQSLEDERRLRQVMEGERRLAAPVYRAALDEGWWETATVEQAAHVYSVAGRFSQLDPEAARAVAECERQAKLRWNIDLTQPIQPLTSQDVDPKVLAASAPAIAGEEREDWGRRLDESAQEHVSQDRGRDAASQDPPARSASRVDVMEAEQATAVAWVKEHYSTHDAPWAAGLDEDAASRQWAHRLYSSLAAEGYDLDAPPALSSLDDRVRPDLEAQATEGYQADLAAATGTDRSQVDISSVIGADSTEALKRSWQAEHDGSYPDPQQWFAHFASQGSRVAPTVPGTVQLAGSPARSGAYTELARRAAAGEAEQAGMAPEAYLDSLQLHQRRALINGYGVTGDQNAASRGRVAAYRIAYAGAAAEARGRGSVAHARTNLEAAEAREALYASGGAPTAATSREQADVSWAQAAETAWDSQAAREQWAQQQLEAGSPPEAVRAAVTGQQALHEPASRATRAPSSPRRRGRARGVRQNGPRRRQQHL
ncbi:hypothetical protein E4J66_06275 [Actinomyces viscosus]|uniref:Uncharacterized protein n=1 Tax=Actinomyces viscosus TaxID=1656 RepID=A0A448PP90_ACTVI|nr:hypothetical protein [Actinomyces viscosus]TFH52815.1 hypothetical protein E4J66_06275 [Actinomyces viscosus]VEI18447.1 Uncharacterised protein [Actinomyces viscosus]